MEEERLGTACLIDGLPKVFGKAQQELVFRRKTRQAVSGTLCAQRRWMRLLLLHPPPLQTGGFSQASSSSGFDEELSELFSFKKTSKIQAVLLTCDWPEELEGF